MANLQWGEEFYRNSIGTTQAYTGYYDAQPVVIKHYRFFTAADLSRACDRAEAQRRLAHEGIVRLITYSLYTQGEDHRLTVVLERMRTDLDSELKVRRYYWYEGEVWGYARTLVLALAYAQEQQVCHRNIQPDNLYFSHANDLKLSNFGKAKVNDITLSVQATDIPYYASPELKASLMSQLEVCDFNPYQSDVYSLGLVLLQMVQLGPSSELCTWSVTEFATAHVLSSLSASPAFKALLGEMLKVQSRMDFLQLREYIEGLYAASPEPSLPAIESEDSPTPDGSIDPSFVIWMLHESTEVQAGLELVFQYGLEVKVVCSLELQCNICDRVFSVDPAQITNEESVLVCGQSCREEAILSEQKFTHKQLPQNEVFRRLKRLRLSIYIPYGLR